MAGPLAKLLILTSIIATSFSLHAETLFEGYYKVLSGGTHVGYMIARYEFDTKKKQFIATTFVKTGELAGNLTESLKAVATEDLKPISYQDTALIGTVTKIVDAKFEKGKMNATIKDGEKTERVNIALPKGTFLSCFLTYLMLKSKEGLKPDTKYDYQAIVEEKAKIAKGFALIKAQEDFNGMKAFRVINEFFDSKFISYMDDHGEIFSVKTPATGISQELVPQPSMATGQFQIPTSLLKVLFGGVPTGQINALSKKLQAQKAAEIKNAPEPASPSSLPPAPAPIPGKQYGVPPGQGIQIKGQPPSMEGKAPEAGQ
jgi:hypothetical protein